MVADELCGLSPEFVDALALLAALALAAIAAWAIAVLDGAETLARRAGR